jgi:hypothetical protein
LDWETVKTNDAFSRACVLDFLLLAVIPQGAESCNFVEFSTFFVDGVFIRFPLFRDFASSDKINEFLFFIGFDDWLIFLEDKLNFLPQKVVPHLFGHFHKEIVEHHGLVLREFFFDTTVILNIGCDFLNFSTELLVELLIDLSLVMALLKDFLLVSDQRVGRFGSLNPLHDLRVCYFDLLVQIRLCKFSVCFRLVNNSSNDLWFEGE